MLYTKFFFLQMKLIKDILNYDEASRIISNFKQNNKKSVFGEEILMINDIDQWIEDHVNDYLELTKYYENKELCIAFMNIQSPRIKEDIKKYDNFYKNNDLLIIEKEIRDIVCVRE